MRNRESFESYTERKRREYGDRFDPSGLDPRFVRYFESGERVKVRAWGEERTGTIGVTTGWKPCFLLMHSSRSRGSSITLGYRDEVLAVKRGRVYVYGAA